MANGTTPSGHSVFSDIVRALNAKPIEPSTLRHEIESLALATSDTLPSPAELVQITRLIDSNHQAIGLEVLEASRDTLMNRVLSTKRDTMPFGIALLEIARKLNEKMPEGNQISAISAPMISVEALFGAMTNARTPEDVTKIVRALARRGQVVPLEAFDEMLGSRDVNEPLLATVIEDGMLAAPTEEIAQNWLEFRVLIGELGETPARLNAPIECPNSELISAFLEGLTSADAKALWKLAIPIIERHSDGELSPEEANQLMQGISARVATLAHTDPAQDSMLSLAAEIGRTSTELIPYPGRRPLELYNLASLEADFEGFASALVDFTEAGCSLPIGTHALIRSAITDLAPATEQLIRVERVLSGGARLHQKEKLSSQSLGAADSDADLNAQLYGGLAKGARELLLETENARALPEPRASASEDPHNWILQATPSADFGRLMAANVRRIYLESPESLPGYGVRRAIEEDTDFTQFTEQDLLDLADIGLLGMSKARDIPRPTLAPDNWQALHEAACHALLIRGHLADSELE